jgi:hypothetical protein
MLLQIHILLLEILLIAHNVDNCAIVLLLLLTDILIDCVNIFVDQRIFLGTGSR